MNYQGYGPAGNNLRGSSAGKFSGDIRPHGYNIGQLSQFTPQQQQLHQGLYSLVSPDSYLGQLAGGNEDFYQQMEQPAWRQFQQAQGQLGSRFAGMGMGATRGSGFQNAAGQLGSDFAMQLASQRQNLRRQAIQELMGYSNMLLGQRPYERFLTQKPEDRTGEMVGRLAGFIPGLFTGDFGGAAKGAMSIFGG